MRIIYPTDFNGMLVWLADITLYVRLLSVSQIRIELCLMLVFPFVGISAQIFK